MFISYSVDTKILETEPLDILCKGCESENLHLAIYKKYFVLYWFLMFPLKRNYMLLCPHCEQTHSKEQYLQYLEAAGKDTKSIAQKLKSRIKNAKTPLYPKISLSIFVLAIAVGVMVVNHSARESALVITNYKQNPSSNVLVVVKDDTEQYPYIIYHVQKVLFDKANVAPAKYSYKTESHAKEAVKALLKEQFMLSFEGNFHPPMTISCDDLASSAITQIQPLRKARPHGPLAPLTFDNQYGQR
ncbi:MAG: hypothetical protein LLF94_09145 [Chlamydiales bacterium]|nr:hypothetical protein [Chlamydiales bacterium]